MTSSHSLVERIAIRMYRAVMRLPLPVEGEEASAFPIDNPALRFRRLQVVADVQLKVLEAKARFWSRINVLLGRLSYMFLLVGFVSILLAAQSARIAFANRNADVVTKIQQSASPAAGFELPSWKITLSVSVGAGLIFGAARFLKRRAIHRLLLAIRNRNDFSAFVLRRRHIVPLQEDCDILELQLQRLNENRGEKAPRAPRPAPLRQRPARDEADSFSWFSVRALRAKIACWLW